MGASKQTNATLMMRSMLTRWWNGIIYRNRVLWQQPTATSCTKHSCKTVFVGSIAMLPSNSHGLQGKCCMLRRFTQRSQYCVMSAYIYIVMLLPTYAEIVCLYIWSHNQNSHSLSVRVRLCESYRTPKLLLLLLIVISSVIPCVLTLHMLLHKLQYTKSATIV